MPLSAFTGFKRTYSGLYKDVNQRRDTGIKSFPDYLFHSPADLFFKLTHYPNGLRY